MANAQAEKRQPLWDQTQGLPRWLSGEQSASQAGGTGSSPGSGRSPAEGIDNRLQYLCLENPMDRGAWWATVQRVAKSQTRLTVHAVGPQGTEQSAPWDA